MIDDCTRIICGLVRVTMGMPANSVRPSDQLMPAGKQTAEYATVKIISETDLGHASHSYVAGGGGLIESVDVPKELVASVNFYKSPTADAAGVATYSRAAFDRAARLRQRLQMDASVELMRKLGLGLLDVSPARDLSELYDAAFESRGQVDLTFNVISRETAAAAAADIEHISVDLSLQTETRAVEVNT